MPNSEAGGVSAVCGSICGSAMPTDSRDLLPSMQAFAASWTFESFPEHMIQLHDQHLVMSLQKYDQAATL